MIENNASLVPADREIEIAHVIVYMFFSKVEMCSFFVSSVLLICLQNAGIRQEGHGT